MDKSCTQKSAYDSEISKVLGASLLMKIDIKEHLNIPEPLTQNQNVNELKLDF